MKHAGDEALRHLDPLLVELRQIPGLVEKKPGIFYKKSRAFLHFHEDPSGLYVDVRLGSDFERKRVETPAEQAVLLAEVRSH